MANILLSEADPDVRRLLAILLERLGHDVIVLDGGPELPPPGDLMLLEPSSPEHLEQAQLARELDPSLPIVCVSILPAEARFLALGPLAHLVKPFTFDQLDATIRAALVPSDCRV